MSNITEKSFQNELREKMAHLRTLTPEQRRDHFTEQVGAMATAIVWLAAHVAILEENGQSLDDLRAEIGRPQVDRLRQVACGRLDPTVMRKFCFEKPSLLNAIKNLPLSDQRRIAMGGDGARVPVVVMESGIKTTRMCDPLEMTQDQIKQVFQGERILSPSEQMLRLESQEIAEYRKTEREEIFGMVIDKVRKVAKGPRGGAEWTPMQLRAILRAMEE